MERLRGDPPSGDGALADPIASDGSDELAARVQAQAQALAQLQATVAALSELLVTSGVVGRDALAVRIAATIAAHQATTLPPSPPVARRAARCTGCGRTVPAGQILFTERGPRCETCCDRLD